MAREYSLAQLADRLSASLVGKGDVIIRGVGALEQPAPHTILYASGRRNFVRAVSGDCAAVICKESYTPTDKPLLLVPDPRQAWVTCLDLFRPDPDFVPGVSPHAVVEEGAQLGEGVSIGHRSVVMSGASIGRDTVVYPGVYIGRDVSIGANCRIHANCVLESGVTIGNNVTLFGGVVVGSDGFGYLENKHGHHDKIPQIGTVVIEDDVEVGANSTIDRATSGATIIGRGTRIDNLVQIAHNVVIGPNNIVVAQAGIAGSVTTGSNCIFAGQVGIADHCTIGDRVVVMAQSGVHSRTLKDHTNYLGTPAREADETRRIYAALGQIGKKKPSENH